jgi:DNA recombination protein RmuC
MSFEVAFYLALVAVVVLVIIYVVTTQRQRTEMLFSRRQVASLQKQSEDLRQEKDRYLSDLIARGEELAAQQVRNEGLQQQLDKEAEQLQQLQERFKKEFEHLAGKLLEEKSEKFTRQNQQQMETILKPFRQRIQEFEKKVQDTYNEEARERFSLQKEIQRICTLNQTLSEQATNLTNALKADTRKQGSWGEVLLERILETSGLQREIHYRRQDSQVDAQGDIKRPDVVILLPENRHVVVDAKVSLTAYERYFNAQEDGDRQRFLKEHLQSIRQHIHGLAGKDYAGLFTQSPDFVLMFIPIEPAYGLALMEDNQLFSDAFRKNVILVGVSSLLATLRIIESLWRLEQQNSNAAEILRQGSQLYDKIVGFVQDMQALGDKLKGAQGEYDQAIKKLSEGKGNLIRKADQMRALGLDTRKRIPFLGSTEDD